LLAAPEKDSEFNSRLLPVTPNAGAQPRRTAPIEGARFAKLFPSTDDDSRIMVCFSKMDFCGLQSGRLKRRRRCRLQRLVSAHAFLRFGWNRLGSPLFRV